MVSFLSNFEIEVSLILFHDFDNNTGCFLSTLECSKVLTEPPNDISEHEIGIFVTLLKQYLLPKVYITVFISALAFHLGHKIFRNFHLRIMDHPLTISHKNGGRHKITNKIDFPGDTE